MSEGSFFGPDIDILFGDLVRASLASVDSISDASTKNLGLFPRPGLLLVASVAFVFVWCCCSLVFLAASWSGRAIPSLSSFFGCALLRLPSLPFPYLLAHGGADSWFRGTPLCCLRLGIWLLPQRSGRLACRYCIIRLRPCVGHCPLQRCGQLDPAGESVWARSAVPSWDGTAASNSLNHMGLTTELSSAECAPKLFWQLQELPKMINLLEDRKSTSERTLRWLP